MTAIFPSTDIHINTVHNHHVPCPMPSCHSLVCVTAARGLIGVGLVHQPDTTVPKQQKNMLIVEIQKTKTSAASTQQLCQVYICAREGLSGSCLVKRKVRPRKDQNTK